MDIAWHRSRNPNLVQEIHIAVMCICHVLRNLENFIVSFYKFSNEFNVHTVKRKLMSCSLIFFM
jgi:hypothetical protein